MAGHHTSLDRVLTSAWKSMVHTLFKQFSLERWLMLGLCGWMMTISGEINTFLNIAIRFFMPAPDQAGEILKRIHSGNHWEQLDHIMNGSNGGFLQRVAAEFQTDPAILHSWFTGICSVVVIFILLLVLCYWVSSRFFFVFLDDLIQEKNEIRRPWREFREIGNSYFLGSLGFLILISAINLLLVATGGFIVWSWLSECAAARHLVAFGSGRIGQTLLLAGGLFVISLVIGFYYWFLYYLLIPIMYRERIGFCAGIRYMNHLFLKHFGSCFLFWLMMLVVQFGLAAVLAVVMMLTCGLFSFIIGLPYIRGVAFLPWFAFLQLTGVELLEELDPRPQPPPEPEAAEPAEPEEAAPSAY